MKYMTKEWCESMHSNVPILLTESELASTYSEKNYKKLYKIKETEWLNLKEECSKVKFEDIYPDDFLPDFGNNHITEEELKEKMNEFVEYKNQFRKTLENLPQFDVESEKKEFRSRHLTACKLYKDRLPKDILEKIADIRVFSLGYAVPEITKELEERYKNINETVETAMDNYDEEFLRQFGYNPPAFSKITLHDSDIISCRKKGKDIEIKIEGVYTDITKLKLKNCTIIKQDERITGSQFLYEEIYKNGDRFELHFLLRKWGTKTHKLLDFIVTVDDVELIKD